MDLYTVVCANLRSIRGSEFSYSINVFPDSSEDEGEVRYYQTLEEFKEVLSRLGFKEETPERIVETANREKVWKGKGIPLNSDIAREFGGTQK